MESNSADDLHLEVLHAYASCRSLPADGKSLNQYIVESLACRQSVLELNSLSSQLFVGKSRHLSIQCHDLIRYFFNLLHFLGVYITKYFFHETHV